MVRRFIVPALPISMVIAFVLVPSVSAAGGSILNAYNLCALTSAVVVVWAVFSWRPNPLWPWLLFAGAGLLWLVGDVAWTFANTTPTLSVSDLFYVAGYVGLIAALVGFLRLQPNRLDVDALIDAALVGLTAALFVWELVVKPSWSVAGVSNAGRLITAIYPLLDLVLIVLLVRLLQSRGRFSVAGTCLTLGMSAIFVGDLVYAGLQQSEGYGEGVARLLDASWLAGYAFIAVAAAHPSMREMTMASTRNRPAKGSLVVAAAALFAIPAVELVGALLGRDIGTDAIVFAAIATTPLVLWRIKRINRFNELARIEAARRETYYRAVATHASDAFILVDPQATILDASDALREMLGYEPSTVAGSDATSIVADDDKEYVSALLHDSCTKPGETVVGETRVRTADARWIWVEFRCTNLVDDPALEGIVVNVHDITRRREVEDDLTHQTFHDGLTGLANRALFMNRVDHALTRERLGDQDVVVGHCNLDGFKTINDTIGRDAGDALLRIVAERLVAAVRPGDTVARLGGDEFAVLLEGSQLPDDSTDAVAARMLEALSHPMEVDDIPLVVTGSIGLAAANDLDQANTIDLLRDADAAMYQAKSAGRNRVVRYEPAMRAARLDRAQLESDLPGAAGRGELVLHYQPIVDLQTSKLKGFEALVRWQHPTRGLLQPGAFISIAEDTGAILEIGNWVLASACHAATRLQAANGLDDLNVSVNVSALQLADGDLKARVSASLNESGLRASCLVLELTESVLVDSPDAVARQLHSVKELGVQLAIDDFGVGYSSLSYLREFPVDILKIDRSFVNSIEAVDGLPAIVQGILELGRTLGLQIIAEGIETDAQFVALRAEGCQFGQGFLFARPVDEQAASHLAIGAASDASRAAA